ncbi:MAG TPA: sigma-70 family RNA polymerase sigma factor [Acidimicrobiales bacterium]
METLVGASTVDAEVVERARTGDEEAWHALVARYVGLVHAICRGYGLRGRTSAEVNQVVWLRLVEYLPRIHTPEAISGWIAATTRAECLRPLHMNGRTSWAAARVTCDGTGLVTAFLRIGVRCQRLLRLVVTEPRPSAEDISAALDVAADKVEPTCARCLDRLGRILDADGWAVLPDLQRIVANDNEVPDDFEIAASNAFGWFTINAPLADKVYDSLTNRTLGEAPSRILSEMRHVRFAKGSDWVDLTFKAKDGEMLLSGNVMPPKPAEVTAFWPQGSEIIRTDEDGEFRFHGLPIAPLSLHIDGARPLKTGWVVP